MAVSPRRVCGSCRRELAQDDEWIALDGGEIWCADCWMQRFGGRPAPAAEETLPSVQSSPPQEVHAPSVVDFQLQAGPPGNAPAGVSAIGDVGQGGWYYLAGGQQVGPLPTEALARIVRAGQVGANVMVWRNGMDGWMPLALVPELAPLAEQAPGAVPILPAAHEVARHNGKSKVTAGLLAILIGGLGIHKFYLGGWGWGLLYIILIWTFIPAIVAFIEGIIYLTMSERAFDDTYNHREVTAFTW